MLEVSRPPIYPQLDLAELARHLAAAIQRRVRDARQALARQGRKSLGAKAVLQQSFEASPKTSELRRNPHPRIAAHHTPERVQAIQSLMAFLHAYRAAWQAWRQGKREQIFPAGTYSLRIHARVACTPACPHSALAHSCSPSARGARATFVHPCFSSFASMTKRTYTPGPD